MLTLDPAQSWLIVLAAILVGVVLLWLMLVIDAHLNHRAALRQQENEDAAIAPVIRLDQHRQARQRKRANTTRLAPNRTPYDWKVQGL